MQRISLAISLFVLVLSAISLSHGTNVTYPELTQPIRVPLDYPTIQAAVNAANPRDAILVSQGTYYENLIVNKTVSVIGESQSNTIIDGSGAGNVVEVTADNVTVKGFTIRNGSKGLYFHGVKNCSICGNNVTHNDSGLDLYSSYNNSIYRNNVTHNDSGLGPYYSTSSGLRFYSSGGNSVYGNNVTNNGYGLFLGSSINNSIYENDIANNNYSGLRFYYSPGNSIFHNNLVNDTVSYDLASQDAPPPWIWHDGYEGNYWSDYKGIDIDGDSVGDTYLPWQGVDYYPLMNPYRGHNVALVGIEMDKTIVGQGCIQKIYAEVANAGSFPQTFNITAHANTTVIETQTVCLEGGNSTIITLFWNTTGFAHGIYTITTHATLVSGEVDEADNNYTHGIVKITILGDINADGKVDNYDLGSISNFYGSILEDPNCDANADVNSDEIIDVRDLTICAQFFD